jgi:hypothetical protein
LRLRTRRERCVKLWDSRQCRRIPVAVHAVVLAGAEPFLLPCWLAPLLGNPLVLACRKFSLLPPCQCLKLKEEEEEDDDYEVSCTWKLRWHVNQVWSWLGWMISTEPERLPSPLQEEEDEEDGDGGEVRRL